MKLFCVILTFCLHGCYDEPDEKDRDSYRSSYNARSIEDVGYHRFDGPSYGGYYNSHVQNAPYQTINYPNQGPHLQRYQWRPVPYTMQPYRLQHLKQISGRIQSRQDDLNRVMQSLDNEQRNFQAELASVNAEYEQNKRMVAMEYDRYYNSVRNMASMQVNYPPEVIYVNAYQPQSLSSNGLVQPFQFSLDSPQVIATPQINTMSQIVSPPQITTMTQITTPDSTPQVIIAPQIIPDVAPTTPPVVVTTVIEPAPTATLLPVTVTLPPPAPQIVPDHSAHIASLVRFVDTCIVLAKQSPPVLSQLHTIRTNVSGFNPNDPSIGSSLNSLALQVNSLLTTINSLPRKTVSEVWIDPMRVSSSSERDKLDNLVVQESSGNVEVVNSGQTDEEINISTSIPNMFSLVSNIASANHRLRVFRDHNSRQIKVIATCFHRRFRKHADKERWFLSFTCDDSSSSLRALTDSGKNLLTTSVLKVVCHSKEFAKRLILEKMNRESRCHINKWTDIARGLPEPKFFALDRSGKKSWRSLADGTGCFSREAHSINSRCKPAKSATRSTSRRREKYDD